MARRRDRRLCTGFMLESPDKKAAPGGLPVGALVFALAAIVGGAGAYFLYQDWVDRAPLLPQLTEEAKAYLPNLDLSDVEMTAEESFIEQTIVRIEGKITNNGTRALRAVDIHCVFREPYGQEVGRELVRIVGRRGTSCRRQRRDLSVWLLTMSRLNGTRHCRISTSLRSFSRNNAIRRGPLTAGPAPQPPGSPSSYSINSNNTPPVDFGWTKT